MAQVADVELRHAQQRQGDRDLRDDQAVAEDASGFRLCSAALSQRRRRRGHERRDSGREPEDERRQQGDADRERQHARIERDLQTRRRARAIACPRS